MGYHLAGFDVVGVDKNPQPRYPFEFHQADALEFLLEDFDAIHASPPCQAYSALRALAERDGRTFDYPELIEPMRARLVDAGVPFVIENVPGAPLRDPVRLCGSSVGLAVQRHRLFESNVPLRAPRCNHAIYPKRFRVPLGDPRRTKSLSRVVAVYGSTRYAGEDAQRREAMGIHWMRRHELTQAIPPAFTMLIGLQLLDRLGAKEAA